MGTTAFGQLLREWRNARRLSQQNLALTADVSARHLSCLETGKARPGRETVARLADALEVPLRERNTLLLAAGFAPLYQETVLTVQALPQAGRAIESILAQQLPYPAFVLNRNWDVLMANEGARRLIGFLMDGRTSRHNNVIRQFFDPEELRTVTANWKEVAGELLHHLHLEIAARPFDPQARELMDEVLSWPGVPARWRARDFDSVPSSLMTTVFRNHGRELHFFSTITTFAAPRDVTLEEMRIECVFPEDDATAAFCRDLMDGSFESPGERPASR